jgi:hypothetical protein
MACAVAGAGACGAARAPTAQSLLRQTFQSHQAIRSGRVDLALALAGASAGGSTPAAAKLFSLRLHGRFQSRAPAQLPRFALALGLDWRGLAGHRRALALAATSTGGRVFLSFGGTTSLLPAGAARALERAYAQALRSRSSGAAASTFAALGVGPGRWLTGPTIVGPATVAGERTVHITAKVLAAPLLADAAKLLGDSRALSLGSGALGRGTGQVPATLSPALLSALAPSGRSGRVDAQVDIYTGARDHVLRRLSLTALVSSDVHTRSDGAHTRSALDGLHAARLTFVLQFADVNRPQSITAPSG